MLSSYLKRLGVLTLSFMISACATVSVQESQEAVRAKLAAGAAADEPMSVYFVSKDPFNAATGAVGPIQDITVRGTLRIPAGQGPFPAVVISNSSGGVDDRVQRRLSVDLVKAGYATFAIQSLEARGQRNSGANQFRSSFQSQGVDVLYALTYLRSLPIIEPNKICVAGKSRGSLAAFNFAYFESFIEMSGYSGEPFACNVGIMASMNYSPIEETTTGKPALVFVGDVDDVWFPEITIDWIEKLQKDGNPISLHILKDTYHGLGTEAKYCPDQQTAKGCREPTKYDAKGIYAKGNLVPRSEAFKQCGAAGYHCKSDNMNMYREMRQVLVEFLERNIKPEN